mgnify:CR=1 FL=1
MRDTACRKPEVPGPTAQRPCPFLETAFLETGIRPPGAEAIILTLRRAIMKTPCRLFLALLATSLGLAARVDPLLLPPPDEVPPSARPVFTLHLNNPTEFDAAFRFEPEIEGEYLTLDAFLEQMHAAISAGQLDLFMRKYERVGLLLLDDVFSELDPRRSAALLAHLPAGQTLLTTAGLLPEGVVADRWLRVTAGRVEEGR